MEGGRTQTVFLVLFCYSIRSIRKQKMMTGKVTRFIPIIRESSVGTGAMKNSGAPSIPDMWVTEAMRHARYIIVKG
ncbi:hypothetical protein TNCV_3819981 [Trichonephila clavipes]|uniref:Uncharacterized protein n=1 Tax=Trichonephila clavipes TaxID=2585209 RepID=A0A8X6UTN4_TRICX|nr:hypothetical protein TNCV_3819981 [Trichonephila clavipes]